LRLARLPDKLILMKNGYDQFFKNARQAASTGEPLVKPKAKPQFKLSDEDLDKQLMLRMGMKPPASKKRRKKRGIPWGLVFTLIIGMVGTGWGIQIQEEVVHFVKNVEVSFVGAAMAEEPKSKKDTAEKDKPVDGKAETKKDGIAKPDGKEIAKADSPAEKAIAANDDQIDHMSKLNDRKKELDEREEELNHMDQDLHAQKAELEKRMKELEDVRRGISSVLEDKVKVDDKKVDTLVLMYSDMKPPQAAKVFETMDEDLAVEILGRMKKKSAADIMNLLKAEKAQVLTEKFAGYKRK
jgi:flagellar motility protein MotE (MotC chaperone)